jgi:hypothetical protein
MVDDPFQCHEVQGNSDMKQGATSPIEQRIAAMQMIVAGYEYYALTLTASLDDKVTWSTQTHWVGFTVDEPKREIREASRMNPARMVEIWRSLGQPCVIVNDVQDLHLFLLIGGNALVATSVAHQKLADLDFWTRRPCANNGEHGFVALENVPDTALRHAPTPRHRMRIITRDDYRCRICGRRPADYTDVELHVHHIRPWGRGGLTLDENLITLCHTCHNGLDPHEDHSLFALIPGSSTDCGADTVPVFL